MTESKKFHAVPEGTARREEREFAAKSGAGEWPTEFRAGWGFANSTSRLAT